MVNQTSGHLKHGNLDMAAEYGGQLASGAQHDGQTVRHELSVQHTSVRLALPVPQQRVVLQVARAAKAVAISGNDMQLSDSSLLSDNTVLHPCGSGGLSDKSGAQLSDTTVL